MRHVVTTLTAVTTLAVGLAAAPNPAYAREVRKIVQFEQRMSAGRQKEMTRMLERQGIQVTNRLPIINAVAVKMDVRRFRGKRDLNRKLDMIKRTSARFSLDGRDGIRKIYDDSIVSLPKPVQRHFSLKNAFGRLKQALRKPNRIKRLVETLRKPNRLQRLARAFTEGVNVAEPGEMPWGIPEVRAPEVWERGITGKGVKVAVIDTGIKLHPDLKNNVRGGVDLTESEKPDWQTGHYHGTHVAGTIAANGKIKGVAPEADLYAVKVLGNNGSGRVSWVIAGIQWAAENNMDVANMSLGSSRGSELLEQAVNAATEKGLTIVAAAGNDYGRPVGFPAAYDNAHAISASTKERKLAPFSSKGPQVFNIAPGDQILSTIDAEGNYRKLRGTSMATPHAAGVMALVKQANPELQGRGLSDALIEGANSLGLPPEEQGAGLVDAVRAVEKSGAPGVPEPAAQAR